MRHFECSKVPLLHADDDDDDDDMRTYCLPETVLALRLVDVSNKKYVQAKYLEI